MRATESAGFNATVVYSGILGLTAKIVAKTQTRLQLISTSGMLTSPGLLPLRRTLATAG